MRDSKQRLVFLPFSMGCGRKSSVAVAKNNEPKKQKHSAQKTHLPPPPTIYKDKEEDVEIEMEIGLPTDVKHITHIGWDGSTTINPIKGWENHEAPEILSLSSISLKQFEVAMAAQPGAQPLSVGSTKMV